MTARASCVVLPALAALAAWTWAADEIGAKRVEHFKNYAKERLAKVEEGHKARQTFLEEDSTALRDFAKTDLEERTLEERQARARIDLLTALESVPVYDRPSVVASYDSLESNMRDAFESAQARRLTELLSSRKSAASELRTRQREELDGSFCELMGNWDKTKAALFSEAGGRPDPEE